jgi:hypothetical protein
LAAKKDFCGTACSVARKNVPDDKDKALKKNDDSGRE